MVPLKWSFLMLLILTMVLGGSGASRGVLCQANPAPPSTANDKMQVAINCALKCMKSGASTCATNGFTMDWTEPGCHESTATFPSMSAYTCIAA